MGKRWWSCPWCCWTVCAEIDEDGLGTWPYWHIRRIHPDVIRVAAEENDRVVESEKSK